MLITMMLFLIPNNSYCYHPLNDYMICMGPGLHKPQGQVIFTSRLPECKIWLHLIEALSLSRPEPMASLVFSNEVLTENEYIWIWLIDSCVQYYSTFRKLIWALWILHNSVDIPEQQWGWGFLLHILPRLRRVGLDQDWQTLWFGLMSTPLERAFLYKKLTWRFCQWIHGNRNKRSAIFSVEHRSKEQGTLAIRWRCIPLSWAASHVVWLTPPLLTFCVSS